MKKPEQKKLLVFYHALLTLFDEKSAGVFPEKHLRNMDKIDGLDRLTNIPCHEPEYLERIWRAYHYGGARALLDCFVRFVWGVIQELHGESAQRLRCKFRKYFCEYSLV